LQLAGLEKSCYKSHPIRVLGLFQIKNRLNCWTIHSELFRYPYYTWC